MKAMVLKEYGGPEGFELVDMPKPEPQAGHVLVKIAATSVNTVDTKIRRLGKKLPISPALPAVLGMDFAGTVEAVGEGVQDFVPGDEVFGCAGGLCELQGALAEYMAADVRLIAHKPESLSMVESAAIPLVGITAYEGLMRGGISQGQKVLVHGGSGGVGHVALQLARYFGADVYSTGGGEKQLNLIRELGATPINYKQESVEEYVEKYTGSSIGTGAKGFCMVFDSVGGENMETSFQAAALNAHVVSTVSTLSIDLTLAHFKGLSLDVVYMLIPMIHNRGREAHRHILQELASIIDAGHLTPIIDDRSFSFTEVGAAHDHLTSGSAMGKVVLTVE